MLFRMHRETMQILSVLKIPVYGNLIFSEIYYCKNYDQVMTKISKARGFSKQRQVWNTSASFFLLCSGTDVCSNLRFSVSSNSSEFIWQIYLCQPQDLYAISYCSFWYLNWFVSYLPRSSFHFWQTGFILFLWLNGRSC